MIVSYSITPKYVKGYSTHLHACMSLKDGTVYPKNFSFDHEHIPTLTPEDIISYFHLKVFGMTDPDKGSKPK